MSTLAERVMEHEGFRNKIYKDTLGFATIGFGHKVTDADHFEEGVEYSREELEKVFQSNNIESLRNINFDFKEREKKLKLDGEEPKVAG